MGNKKKSRYKLRIIPKDRRSPSSVRSRRIALGLAGFFIVAISVFMFMKSDYFTIAKITVQGNEKLTSEEVIDASAIRKGDNLFDYSAKKAQDAVLSISYVKDCEIVRSWPDEVYINISEKPCSMAYLSSGVYYCLDSEGFVLSAESSAEEVDAMIVSLHSTGESVAFSEGDRIDFSADPSLGIAKKIYEFSEKNGLDGLISEYYVSESGVNYIYTSSSAVVKFYTYSAFEDNLDFIKDFILYEDRHIMAEVVEGTRPVYKVIGIE